ncbi:histidine ammonia-lyase [soil metagenome]
MTGILALDGRSLTLADVAAFESARPRLRLDDSARGCMDASVSIVHDAIRDGRICYGVNTGFGAFANRQIAADQVTALQYNLVRSHACGIGEPLADSIVRRMMLLKANSLAAGCSGIRPHAVEVLLALLEHDITPVIPAKGSVGASGDLAPLAHLALALIGEGEAHRDGKLLNGAEVLEAAGCAPVELEAKEGLALLNGTQASASLALEGLFAAETLLIGAVLAGAMSVEGLAGSYTPFDARIHDIRRMVGQKHVARQFRALLTDSEIRRSHEHCDRVQDPYSVRCMPQVYGAVWDTLAHAAGVLALDLNAVSDNPLIFGEDILSGGNFHAEPLGFVSDFMSIAVAELASMSERRTDLLERRVNPNLNMFLTSEPGLESGFMIAHVATAALVSENKTLAHPASIDSIPTSAGQEDHVAMAPWAGMKLLDICRNTSYVLAIELLAAAHAIDDQRPLLTTPELQKLHAFVRERVPFTAQDHRMDGEIALVARALRNGEFSAFLPDRGRPRPAAADAC